MSLVGNKMNSSDFDDFLDITKDQCPITFLKASLKLEEMNIGASSVFRQCRPDQEIDNLRS